MRRILLFLCLVGASWLIYIIATPYGPKRETFIEVTPGMSSRQIARVLEHEGIIRNPYAFDLWRVWEKVRKGDKSGDSLKAGEYRFDHPERIAGVYDRIRRGDVFTISVTIPEGSNLFDIGARIAAAHLVTSEVFVQAAQRNSVLVADLDPHAASLEGYLFPDTYHFGRRTTVAQILTAMVKRFRVTAASLGLQGDVHRVVTLASLVERETPINTERPLVASVFTNRLAREMPLMTDPSVIYAAVLAGNYRGTIYQSDLNANSPYNTYRHAGLPPGPICNPGAASLRAALQPAETNYLYFVAASADPSGRSRFSSTLEEHQKNVQEYRRATKAGSQP